MSLTAVTEALERIAGPEEYDVSEETPSSSGEKSREYFCIEDTLLTRDIEVSVKGVGKLSFPLMEENIKDIMKVSSKAKFGRGEQTVLDTSVRDTQVISASNLKVDINGDALSDALERMCTGLNLNRSASLVPHLFNMLIYGPGQFFKMHRDSEKMKNMVATLVVLLPSLHKGGDLVIQQNKKKHIFFCSKNPDIVKCVVFYSDCQHEIKEVTDGYRVALTYNVVLDVPEVTNGGPLDEGLNNSVHNYFNTPRTNYMGTYNPKKLVYLLNHSYSEHSLKWDFLKGADRSCALALLTVAKHQGRLPCLALAEQMETYDAEEYGESDVLNSETTLYFWVNENSLQFKETKTSVSDGEMCFTKETSDIFDPYKTEESGPTGNEGETRDHWYKRACVVLWTNNWVCSTGFKDAILDLHSLTTSDGNKDIIRNAIDNAGEYFYETKMWFITGVIDLLVDIVRYVNDSNIAIGILSNLPLHLLKEDKFDCFLQLERQFDNETWLKIFTGWKKNLNLDEFFNTAMKFVEHYVRNKPDVSKSLVVDLLLKDCGDAFIKRTQKYTNQRQPVLSMPYSYNINTRINCRYIYDKKTSREISDELCSLLHLCVVIKNSLLENRLIQHAQSTPSVFPSQGLAELYLKLREIQPSESERYKPLADKALASLHQDLTELKKHGESWCWPIHIPCACQFCVQVQSFFNSPVINKVSIPAAAQNRAHVYSFLNPLTDQPVSFNTLRCGSPFKIEIEKNKKLLTDRKSLIKELIDVKNKLLACTTLLNSNEDSINPASTSENQNLNQPMNAMHESVVPTKKIKM